MSNQIKKLILKVSKYIDTKLQDYFMNEEFPILYEMKLYLDDIYTNCGQESGFTDNQYDMLKETMIIRDPTYIPEIGSKVRSGENRVQLPYWMGSMDKIKSEDINELGRWVLRNFSEYYIIEEKLDGVSCLMVIKDGDTKLYKRGTGIEGSDISYLLPYFSTVPKNINQNIVVRGELIMKKSVFTDKFSEKYANARNFVSGRTGGKTVRNGIRDIDFVAYEIVYSEHNMTPFSQIPYLESIGFNTVKYEITNEISVDILTEILLRFKEESRYEMDGIIVQSNIEYERNTSGNPDYAFAFKIRTDIISTEVLEVEWNVSKWGVLKPRVKVRQVSLGGVNINYASGHNGKSVV